MIIFLVILSPILIFHYVLNVKIGLKLIFTPQLQMMRSHYISNCVNEGDYVELEKWDGYKTIDIAIVNTRWNIEINESYNIWNGIRAIAGLKRTYFSIQKGYFTILIPNIFIQNHLYEKLISIKL